MHISLPVLQKYVFVTSVLIKLGARRNFNFRFIWIARCLCSTSCLTI